jgi:hypothetical protein
MITVPAVAHQHFVSRPDLQPPRVTIVRRAGRTAPGYIFIAPKKNVAQAGPLILDNAGHVVWFHPIDTGAVTDYRVQRYRGHPVLTWWRSKSRTGREVAPYIVYDQSYRLVATVQPANDLGGDIHEFRITRRNTALITVSHYVGFQDRKVLEGGFQEIDIETGRLLFQWLSTDHVALAESYYRPPRDRDRPFDYFHINSVHVDRDGDFLISARNTHTVYKVSRRTGGVLWRLGGKRSDFDFGRRARFAWQHDARRLPDSTLSLFDNEAAPPTGIPSRGIVLRLDMKHMHATLVRAFVHRPPLVAVDQGNMQRLPNGHFFVGWGHLPWFTEFDRSGRVVLDGRFGRGADSYRAYRFRWMGNPSLPPAIAVSKAAINVSWNGATGVARWQLLAGPSPNRLRPVRSVRRAGFETRIELPRGVKTVAVRGLDRTGRALRMSRALRLG